MRFAHVERAQSRAHRGGYRRIDAHVGREGVSVGQTGLDQFLDVFDLARQVAHLQCLARLRGVLALNCANGGHIRSRRYEKYRILAAILRFPENLDRTAEHDLADLRAEILERTPANRMKR
ncbi:MULTISPECIES: hypothetical protein [unclassified Sphingomonas]|uniref:hypothetical protein n=1 Tax=Novosphingobium rhizosphaerae TaxID=1551649 RepID=UPI0017EF6434